MDTKILRGAFLLTAAVVLVANAAHAAPPDTTEKPALAAAQTNPGVYRELAELRTQNAILTEKLKNAELQSKVDAAKGGYAPSAPSAPSSRSRQPVATYFDSSARVLMVAGAAGQLVATFQLSNGGNTVGRVGTHVPTLGLVKSVKTNEVLVENGKDIISVPFASEPMSNGVQYASPYSQQPPSGPIVPPLSGTPPLPPMGSN